MSCTEVHSEQKRKVGRPLGSGKSDPQVREYWRLQKTKRKQREEKA
jgi:hypothetical protein